MRSLALRLILVLSLLGMNVHADPENLLVEGYTFVRPKNWTWDAQGKGSAVNWLAVPGSETDVRFYVFPQTEEQIRERLLGNFEKGAVIKDTSIKVGDTRLDYVMISGQPSEKLKKGKRNLKVVGVCLRASQEKKMLLIRLYGPPRDVDAATADFKHMVEKAVEEFSK